MSLLVSLAVTVLLSTDTSGTDGTDNGGKVLAGEMVGGYGSSQCVHVLAFRQEGWLIFGLQESKYV